MLASISSLLKNKKTPFLSVLVLSLFYFYHNFLNNYVVIENQPVSGIVKIKELRLVKGGFFAIKPAKQYGEPSDITFFNSFYLPPGTYKNLRIRLATIVPIPGDLSPAEIYYWPFDLTPSEEKAIYDDRPRPNEKYYKYSPKPGDVLYVQLYKLSDGAELILDQPRTKMETEPLKNIFGRQIQTTFVFE